MTIADRVRSLLAGGHVPHALEVALAAAKEAGDRAADDNRHLPPAERFAVALQAADEVLEGIAVDLAGSHQDAGEEEAAEL